MNVIISTKQKSMTLWSFQMASEGTQCSNVLQSYAVWLDGVVPPSGILDTS